MKIALLTTDNRENERDYSRAEPSFGTAPEALLRGFRELDDLEIHVISCLKKEVAAPERLAPNIYYHAVVVPSIGWLKTGYLGMYSRSSQEAPGYPTRHRPRSGDGARLCDQRCV